MTEGQVPAAAEEGDQPVLHRITELIDLEHRLREHLQTTGDAAARTEDRQELARAEEALDQCWDLLRQRQARRTSGQNPDDATARPVSEVEGYLQ